MTSRRPADPDTPAEAPRIPPSSTVAYLFRNISLPAITSTVMAFAVAYFLRGHFPDLWLGAWLAAILLVNGFRYLILGHGRQAPPGPAETRRWMVLYFASVAVAGIVWGVAGWVFFPTDSVPLQVFLAFILGGMAVGAMASYGAWLPAFFAYTVPSLTPIAIRFVWETDKVSVAMGGMVAVFAIALSFLARNVRLTLRRSYDLQMTHDLILDAVGEGIYGVDLEGRVTFVNPAAARMLGWDADDLIGKVAHDALHHSRPDGTPYPSDECPIYAALVDGSVHRVWDEVFWRQDGSAFPVEYISTPIRRGDDLVGAVVVFRDITDRRLAEEKLRQSEARYRTVVENATDGIFVHDDRGRIFDVNECACASLGYTRDELMALNVADVEMEFEAPDTKEKLMSLGSGSVTLEGVHRRKDGITFPVEVHVGAFDAGERRLFIALVRDVTDRKLAEEVLRQSEERHREFAANAAHELRTPLAVMRSHLDNLDDSAAASLREDVDGMSRLVEQLLAATRLDFLAIGAADRADLGQVCRNVAENLAPIAINDGRSIEVVGGTPPVFIRGDAGALEQAVRNLVENALRYSGPGTTVTIEVGADATIAVVDRGPGIPAEARDAIFERFHRIDQRTGGAGLGLSIVHRTVGAHAGTIEVADAPGGGAVFTMRFPLMESAAE